MIQQWAWIYNNIYIDIYRYIHVCVHVCENANILYVSQSIKSILCAYNSIQTDPILFRNSKHLSWLQSMIHVHMVNIQQLHKISVLGVLLMNIIPTLHTFISSYIGEIQTCCLSSRVHIQRSGLLNASLSKLR